LLCYIADDLAKLTQGISNAALHSKFIQNRRDWSDGGFSNNGEQQDANEAFLKIVDTCHEIYSPTIRTLISSDDLSLNPAIAYETPVWHIFGLSVREEITSKNCGHKPLPNHSKRNEVQLALPEDENDLHSIGSLLMAQLGEENLGSENNLDICEDGCGQANQRTKSIRITCSGEVLVIQLLRFKYNNTKKCAEKLETKVNNDVLLPCFGPSMLPYKLRAVVEHQGLTLNCGHYIAYVRDNNDRWYLCNDSAKPLRCEERQVLKAEAYMLFYERLS